MSADSTAGDAAHTTVAAPDYALDAVTVTQERGPDRCTVYPTDADEETRLTTWLSLDADATCDLATMR
ncbi:hypothetical protein EFA46_000035 [Halarchaeum sp. CBA1220]|uniref:DUF7511 domain-containing protein n=1 Tax=Halarchaeum sp. CBA1220 TaxID=1853682 RepID=UPI000F3A82BD|nr:hypothetical protein [Halarchaeum sp. CBA1220]QLC32662.1 hypothetical protein EFA46_000035 [Halarchaeum sp. CBA1220]